MHPVPVHSKHRYLFVKNLIPLPAHSRSITMTENEEKLSVYLMRLRGLILFFFSSGGVLAGSERAFMKKNFVQDVS